MIDIAVIASTPHLHDLSAAGSIDMALTHIALRHPGYAAYFRARAATGITVLLDNSAYELEHATGQGLAAQPVLAAADLTGAGTVVCQDVLFDGPATVTATHRFLDAARQTPTSATPGRQFMAVPQGSTRAEWWDCYQRLLALPDIAVIGLSKLSVPRCYAAPVAEARLTCVADLLNRGHHGPLHLLGGDRSLPWELAEHRRRGHTPDETTTPAGAVVSNDSSFAYWYAAAGIPLDVRSGRASRAAPDKPDLEHTCLHGLRLAAAKENIRVLRRAAGLPAPATSPSTPPTEIPGQEVPPCR